jgi:dihydrolipoamide dehydrogenase
MKYNVIIIGAGPAGLEAAKRCAKYKLKALLIEKSQIGGVCLNQGCIPTKFYLTRSKTEQDFSVLSKQKETLISGLRSRTLAYLKSQNIDILNSKAEIKDRNTVRTEKGCISTDFIIIATGSRPVSLPGLNLDKTITPENFLDSGNIQDRYLIVGAGAIGVEFSFLLSSLSKRVHLIEKEDVILPFLDREISKRAQSLLVKKGVNIKTNQDVKDYDLADFDRVIVSVGRRPNLEGLGLEKIGISIDKKKGLERDDYLRTKVPNVYLAGDAGGRFFYAYTAEYEGGICVENIVNKGLNPDYKGLPHSIFTSPSLSSCGFTEQEVKEKGISYSLSKYTFKALSSSFVYDDTQGFAKLISDKQGYILGAHLLSNISHEIIGYFSLCMRNNLRKEVLEKLILVHPTISEFITKI